MLRTIVVFLPAITCLFWFILHLMMASRTRTFGIVAALLLVTGAFLVADASYNTRASSLAMRDMTVLFAQLFAPAIIPLIIMYFRRLKDTVRYTYQFQLLWVVVPVILFTGAVMLHTLSGTNSIQEMIRRLYTEGPESLADYKGTLPGLYFVWADIVTRSVIAAEMLVLIAYFAFMFWRNGFRLRTFFAFIGGGKIRLRHLQAMIISFIFLLFFAKLPHLGYMDNKPWPPIVLAILLTIGLFAFSYIALFGDKKTLTPSEIHDILWTGMSEKQKQDREEIDSEEKPHGILAEIAESLEENSLIARFHQLMKEERLFLQPQLTLQDVAEKLHSNKTYVSKLVNNTYNMGFPELINKLRVEYAEQYILTHRDAIQAEIAAECGFLSASTFNNIFTKIKGMTPKAWIASKNKNLTTPNKP